jgi:hypothetical protein
MQRSVKTSTTVVKLLKEFKGSFGVKCRTWILNLS